MNLIKLQSFHETGYATLVTIHVFINKCCNVYVFYIPQKKYKKIICFIFFTIYVLISKHIPKRLEQGIYFKNFVQAVAR
jgi:hypothetical protein